MSVLCNRNLQVAMISLVSCPSSVVHRLLHSLRIQYSRRFRTRNDLVRQSTYQSIDLNPLASPLCYIMPPHLDNHHRVENKKERTTLSPKHKITPDFVSGSRFSDLTASPPYSETQTQAPGGGSRGETYEADNNLLSATPSRALPPFVRHHSHLPTPYSPSNMSSYLHTTAQASGSSFEIVPSSSSSLPTEISLYRSPSPPPPFRSQNILTPESSPLAIRSRGNSAHFASNSKQKGRHDVPMAPTTEAKRAPSPESVTEQNSPPDVDARPANPENSRDTTHFSQSGGLSTSSAAPKSSTGALLHVEDDSTNQSVFDNSLSRGPSDEAGGEISRIRAQLMVNQLALAQEAEARRPDYLKRTKRLAPYANLSIPSDSGREQSPQQSSNIGVTDSPVKGRRLTLFQETSDESFEESLMAGGYGRYRSDWSSWRSFEDEGSHHNKGAMDGVSAASSSKTRLYPVEVEGRGRVLMDFDPLESQPLPKPSPSKGKRSRKKKKASTDVTELDNSIVLKEADVDGPNWPDGQFPWRFQSVQQDGYSRIEQEERMRYIESFFDRDSDQDSDVEDGSPSPSRATSGETLPSPRPGGGKIYPLASHSQGYDPRSIGIVPSDPADARTALLSKKSIQAFRLRRLRSRNLDAGGEDGEIMCICNGQDDGRELVQCDACRTWYHLECIGIQSPSELGGEEDPWFCANCAEVKTPPPVAMALSEPIFVPTEEGNNVDDEYDPPFFHAGLNPSPATPWTRSMGPPMTPPRTQPGPYFSSGSSWDEPSSHGGPHTPQFPSQDVHVYTVTPGRVEPLALEESPFDPTSTPSRGIKLSAPFATPQTGLWPGRAQELFHTPTRPGEGASRRRHKTHNGSSRGVEEGTSTVPLSSSNNSVTQDFTLIGRNLGGRLLESPLGAKRSRRTALSVSQERPS
ncbi:hypothetical protein F5I97DRAFT_1969279 [Phlebopus sp. FC_14]|nr:hypothetical protein F5I97DRAFT_1969279 [Phlebopus sp. FC_14]